MKQEPPASFVKPAPSLKHLPWLPIAYKTWNAPSLGIQDPIPPGQDGSTCFCGLTLQPALCPRPHPPFTHPKRSSLCTAAHTGMPWDAPPPSSLLDKLLPISQG